MELKTFKSDFVLLTAASIWGLAFVAQRMGMEHVGPFTFNGVRFALGGLSLLPFLSSAHARRKARSYDPLDPPLAEILSGSLMSGCILFAGASLQQVGLVYTTAGKAGFITGLYVVLVPILGLFWKQKAGIGTWAGAAIAALGMYFLSVTDSMTMGFGDVLELAGALFFAMHVLLIGRLSGRMDTLRLSFIQCMVCSLASLTTAAAMEVISLDGIWQAAIPIVYGGVFSVGIAYSLQIYGQKTGNPAHAAILLSLESVVAALGGWLILGEVLSGRAIAGCVLMMSGMLVSQLYNHMTLRQSGDRA
ncbi:MAG: DMT family transporter [Pseudomonadota bacterium]